MRIKIWLSLFALLIGVPLSHRYDHSIAQTAVPIETKDRSEQRSGTAVRHVLAVSVYKTFGEWKAACNRLPFNRTLKQRIPPKELLPLKSFKEFDEVLEAFLDLAKTGTLSNTNDWVGQIPSRSEFFNTDKIYFKKNGIPFQPFGQKLTLNSEAQVLLHGDFHGDVHSLVAWLDWLNKKGDLNGFKLARPNTYMVFLGDYTDRGMYGVEVLYTLFRLKLENPDRVLLVRGNHEDVSLAVNYGFLAEIQAKYGREFNVTKVLRAYDFLPVVIYVGVGNDFIQCNHGGMEPGYDPASLLEAKGATRFQLLGRLRQARFVQTNPTWTAQMDPSSKRIAEANLQDFQPESPVAPSTLGFMWNDFSVVKGEPELGYDPGRAFIYGEHATQFLLKTAGQNDSHVQAVFRAHQHSSVINPMMRRLKAANGVYRHWQEGDSIGLLHTNEGKLKQILESAEERRIPSGSVWTFNVAPDTVYGEGCDFDFDSFAILKLAAKFEDWRLDVFSLPITKQ